MALQSSGFTLEFRKLDSLLPHEETIPAHVDDLARDCAREGIQKDPVLADIRTGTVLDGMHRLAAFKKIGLRSIVCCSLDYNSEAARISRWARVYSGPGSAGLAKLAKDSGLTKELAPMDAVRGLSVKGAGLAVMTGGVAMMPETRMELDRSFSTVRRLDQEAEARGLRRTFVPEDALEAEQRERSKVVVLVESLAKRDVVEAANTGRLFPCKTSMHVVDPRPVAIDIPLEEVRAGRSPKLEAMARESRGEILPSNSEYGGRRYKERLLLLSAR